MVLFDVGTIQYDDEYIIRKWHQRGLRRRCDRPQHVSGTNTLSKFLKVVWKNLWILNNCVIINGFGGNVCCGAVESIGGGSWTINYNVSAYV